MSRRKQLQDGAEQPSTKRRRLTSQGADEAFGNGMKDVELPPGEEPTFIFFDLETTGLIRGTQMPHITQIAAVELQSGREFNKYVLPKMALTDSAKKVTGIDVDGSGGMTVKGKQVQPESIHSAIIEFCKWLKKFNNVFLVAHYGKGFDFPIFLSCLMNAGSVKKFGKRVSGLIDSLPVFEKCFPGKTSYKQQELAKSLLKVGYNAHNALEDVKVLGKLVSHTKLNGSEIVAFSFSPSAIQNSL